MCHPNLFSLYTTRKYKYIPIAKMWGVCINLLLSLNAIASIRTGYHTRVLQMKMDKLTLQPISRITGEVRSR